MRSTFQPQLVHRSLLGARQQRIELASLLHGESGGADRYVFFFFLYVHPCLVFGLDDHWSLEGQSV